MKHNFDYITKVIIGNAGVGKTNIAQSLGASFFECKGRLQCEGSIYESIHK